MKNALDILRERGFVAQTTFEDELNKAFAEKLKGRVMPVLFEIKNKDGYWEGHTANYIKVLLKSDEELKNRFVDVKIGEYCGDETVYGS